MLKLLRMGDTNVFAVIDEKIFNKNMEVEGYVRIEKYPKNDAIRRLFQQNEDWLEEVKKLGDEKRTELYNEENGKIRIN